ncbi:hypothetical protein BD410DRAFT_836107 [Rickenella mellea]|uniref:Uncharacterized protein n=1 Tax=Rickenella mellea TaxID=50990 RepID=A0A4Y7QH95_9AGAM|nr:hypothetical protein BD410DRAFT_836107 [Rickenella mellea]
MTAAESCSDAALHSKIVARSTKAGSSTTIIIACSVVGAISGIVIVVGIYIIWSQNLKERRQIQARREVPVNVALSHSRTSLGTASDRTGARHRSHALPPILYITGHSSQHSTRHLLSPTTTAPSLTSATTSRFTEDLNDRTCATPSDVLTIVTPAYTPTTEVGPSAYGPDAPYMSPTTASDPFNFSFVSSGRPLPDAPTPALTPPPSAYYYTSENEKRRNRSRNANHHRVRSTGGATSASSTGAEAGSAWSLYHDGQSIVETLPGYSSRPPTTRNSNAEDGLPEYSMELAEKVRRLRDMSRTAHENSHTLPVPPSPPAPASRWNRDEKRGPSYT